jgi:hypothetical protein
MTQITKYVTCAVTLAIEQMTNEQQVAHGAATNLDAGKPPCWAGATFAHGSVHKVSRGSLRPNKRLPSARPVRIWAKQVKKVGITYFSFVFTISFSL